MEDIFKNKRIEKIDGDKMFLSPLYEEFLREVQNNTTRCLNHMTNIMKMIDYQNTEYCEDAIAIGQLANMASKKELERVQEEFKQKSQSK